MELIGLQNKFSLFITLLLFFFIDVGNFDRIWKFKMNKEKGVIRANIAVACPIVVITHISNKYLNVYLLQ